MRSGPWATVLMSVPVVAEFLREDGQQSDGAEFDRQLAVTWNAACSWERLMSHVNLDLFKGFASEDHLIKYFLKKAYFDNVTIFASQSVTF